MNIEKFKNLITKNGDKFVLVENGEPEIILMSFKEYEKLVGRDTVIGRDTVEERKEKDNTVISNLNQNDDSDPAEFGEEHMQETKFDIPPSVSKTNTVSRETGFGGKPRIPLEEFSSDVSNAPASLLKDFPIRLENIGLEDLPI